MEYLAWYKQTAGGDYDSRPKAAHVQEAWAAPDSIDNHEWAQEALRRGHGEYLDNVVGLIKAMKDHKMTKADVPLTIDLLEPTE